MEHYVGLKNDDAENYTDNMKRFSKSEGEKKIINNTWI